MEVREIVEQLGRERRVEEICRRVTHLAADSLDLQDLSQMLYLVLLEYDPAKLQDLWDNGEINFLIVRLAVNNFRSSNSRFHYLIRVFRERAVDLSDLTSNEQRD